MNRFGPVVSHATELRHRLHTIPELHYGEFKTAALIREELNRIGLPFHAGVPGAETATISVIGNDSKPCIAFRADIDALPIEEQSGVSYRSTHPGRMHACGHDGHTAILLGTAAMLKELSGTLPVCVKLIWQPAEETGGGAGRLVKAGVLNGRIGPRVRAVFGLHGWPTLHVGKFSTKSGPLMASTDSFAATFVGRGCHGAYPHMGVDPVVAACEAVVNLQQCVSRELDPVEPGLITVGTIQGGTAVNIIPDTAQITGTARCFTAETRSRIKRSIARRCAGIASANGCNLEFEWTPGYPATINHPAMTEYATRVIQSKLGAERFIPALKPSMGGEDFAYYLDQVPGAFLHLGICPCDRQEYHSLHSNRFDFTDEAIGSGVTLFVNLALEASALPEPE